MKIKPLIISLLFTCFVADAFTQKLDYEVFQVGNDYPGNPFWVPHDIADIFVTPEGTVYTNAKWVENGAGVSEIHPDGTMTRLIWTGNSGGGHTITANETYIYFAGNKHREGNQGVDRRDRSNPDKSTNVHVDCGDMVYGLVLSSSRVYAAVRDLNVVRVFDLDLNPREAENIVVNAPEEMALDKDGNLWVLQPSRKKIIKLDPTTRQQTGEIVLASYVDPTDITIDKNNKLYVTDKGENEQIRIYRDIATNPSFEKTFGTRGGIFSGSPGVYAPLKLVHPIGIGIDDKGNIHVGNRPGKDGKDQERKGDNSGNGSTIVQKYTPSGELLWDVMCVIWIDMIDKSPTNENIVYGSGEKMRVDYEKGEWELLSLTIDRHRYPDDFRIRGDGHLGATFIRDIQGQRFMYLTDMGGSVINLYRFDGEIAVPTGHISEDNIWYDADGDGQMEDAEIRAQSTGNTRDFWVDADGNIWQASTMNGIYKYRWTGIDEHGALEYPLSERIKYNMPAPYTELRRVRFYPGQHDLMVLNGFTSGPYRNIDHHTKRAGKVYTGYRNWEGSFDQPVWEIVPPFEDRSTPYSGDGNVMDFEVVDDYLFMAHNGSSEELGYERGRISVWKKDSTFVGYMEPPPEMIRIGILDITEAMTAYQIASGHYIIAIEDDGKAKIIVYKWCPSGDCN